MAEKLLNRIMLGAKTPEGKVVTILLTLALAFMVWDTRTMQHAFASQEVTASSSEKALSGEPEATVEGVSDEVVVAAGEGDATTDDTSAGTATEEIGRAHV